MRHSLEHDDKSVLVGHRWGSLKHNLNASRMVFLFQKESLRAASRFRCIGSETRTLAADVSPKVSTELAARLGLRGSDGATSAASMPVAKALRPWSRLLVTGPPWALLPLDPLELTASRRSRMAEKLTVKQEVARTSERLLHCEF